MAAPKPAVEGMDVFGWVFLGRTKELDGDIPGAAQAYAKAVELDPESALAAVSLARVLYRSGNPVSAAGILSKVRDLGDPWVGIAMVDVLDAAGQGSKADEAAARTLLLAPLPEECARWLSRRALKKGDVTASAAFLAKAVAPTGNPGQPSASAGFLLLDHGRASDARDFFRDSVALEPLGRGRLGLAMALDSMRDWRSAADEAEAYCRANPSDAKGAVTASAILARAGRTDKALLCLENACGFPSAGAAPHAALGRICRMLGRPKEGASALSKARTLAPSDRKIAFEYATALAESGSLGEAEALLEKLAGDQDSEPHVRAYLAYILAFGGRRLEQAASLAGSAIAADGGQGFYHAVFGFVKHKTGDRAAAEEEFALAMACDADPMALKLHGEFLYDTGRQEEARLQWKKAIELDPRLREALEREMKRK